MDSLLKVHGGAPRTIDLADAIMVTADTLGASECYRHDGRYHFPLGGGWSIAISSDSADRIRVEACKLTRPESMFWVLARKHDRLAGLVKRMSQVAEPV